MTSSANVLVGTATVDWYPITAETKTPDPAIVYGTKESLGWTSDGVTMTVATEAADIKVEEVIGTLKRVVTDQTLEVTLNMAEGTLDNLNVAIPRTKEDPAGTLTLGVPDNDTFPYLMGKLVLTGEAPSGKTRTVTLYKVSATGSVGIPYKKGEISVIPVTFSAMKDGIPANTATYDKFGEIKDS